MQIIKNLLNNLPHSDECNILPATTEEINTFVTNAINRKVPDNVIQELIELYCVANTYFYEIVIGFHNCTDQVIYEWWSEYGELWLGQRDFNTLRWANGKFCLGDASNISYGKEYESENLIGLIEICLNEINQADYFDETK